MRIVVPQILL